MNGNIFVLGGILRIVVCSVAEAELGALLLNTKDCKIPRLVMFEMSHHWPPTPVYCDNNIAAGITNDTVENQRSRSMEMWFFLVKDQAMNKELDVQWYPVEKNLADYFTKHFETTHHQSIRLWYVYKWDSPRELPRATGPKELRGCAGIQDDGYTKDGPLPRINPIQWFTSAFMPLAKLSRSIGAATWY